MFNWFQTKRKNVDVEIQQYQKAVALHNMVALVATDRGNVRTNNEDYASICKPLNEMKLFEKGVLLVLADGMGGHNGGEVASNMAVNIFAKAYYNFNGNIKQSLKYAIKKANTEIYEKSLTDASLKGMGTTCTALIVHEKNIYLTQVGDSRAYYFTNKEFVQLSKDQTLVQFKIDSGVLSVEEAATHPERNVLTNALGTKPFIEADISKLSFVWKDDTVLFICSDGLYEYVKMDEINLILNEQSNIEIAAQTLIELAKGRGGHDNITILLASFSGCINESVLKETNPGG